MLVPPEVYTRAKRLIYERKVSEGIACLLIELAGKENSGKQPKSSGFINCEHMLTTAVKNLADGEFRCSRLIKYAVHLTSGDPRSILGLGALP